MNNGMQKHLRIQNDLMSANSAIHIRNAEVLCEVKGDEVVEGSCPRTCSPEEDNPMAEMTFVRNVQYRYVDPIALGKPGRPKGVSNLSRKKGD